MQGTNGLPEAMIMKYTSTPRDGLVARCLGLLPVLLRPDRYSLGTAGTVDELERLLNHIPRTNPKAQRTNNA